jgi:hypothetical protein
MFQGIKRGFVAVKNGFMALKGKVLTAVGAAGTALAVSKPAHAVSTLTLPAVDLTDFYAAVGIILGVCVAVMIVRKVRGQVH